MMTSLKFVVSPPSREKAALVKRNENVEPPTTLYLAPFQPTPYLTFADVPIGSTACRKLSIKNLAGFHVTTKFSKTPSSTHGFEFSDVNLELDLNEEGIITILWTPKEPGSWRETLRVNYIQNSRNDLPVNIQFNAVKPAKKLKRPESRTTQQILKPIRRVFQMPQTQNKVQNMKTITELPENRRETYSKLDLPASSNGEDKENSMKPIKSITNSKNLLANRQLLGPSESTNKKVAETSVKCEDAPISLSPLARKMRPPSAESVSCRPSRRSRSVDLSSPQPTNNRRSQSAVRTLTDFTHDSSFLRHLDSDFTFTEPGDYNGPSIDLSDLESPFTQNRRSTFLVTDGDLTSRDHFCALKDKILPSCDDLQSPLRRTTYLASEIADATDQFRPVVGNRLPPCDIASSPLRRTTYLTSDLETSTQFRPVIDNCLPPCDVTSSPLRRTTYLASDAMPSLNKSVDDNLRTPSPTPRFNFSDIASPSPFVLPPTGRSSRKKIRKSSYTLNQIEESCVLYSTGKRSVVKTSSTVTRITSSSDSNSPDSLDEGDSPKMESRFAKQIDDFCARLDSSDLFKDTPVKAKSTSQLRSEIPLKETDALHVSPLTLADKMMRRCSSETFTLSPSDAYLRRDASILEDDAFYLDVNNCSKETYTKSPAPHQQEVLILPQDDSFTKSLPRTQESAASVIGAGLWLKTSSKSKSPGPVAAITPAITPAYGLRSRSVSNVPTSDFKVPASRAGKVGITTSASASADRAFVKPSVGVGKGGKKLAPLTSSKSCSKLISIKRARAAIRSLSFLTPRKETPKSNIQSSSLSIPNPDDGDFLYALANPNPFAATTCVDPFVMSHVYHSDEWLSVQERDFVKLLNDLLTPADELDSNAEPPKVDLASMWQQSCRKAAPTLAPSVEAVSSRVITLGRLDAVRKACAQLYRSPDVAAVLTKVVGHVDKGLIAIRKDRQIHLDVGLKSTVLGLLLSYNPLWLRIGLETVFGQSLELASNSDWVGLGGFIATRLLDDPHLVKKHSHPATNLRLPSYQEAIGKFMLKKFLAVIYLLDRAKERRLIGHDPCLFCKNAEFKESREVLLSFARELIAGMGDITKHLRTVGYTLTHKQTYLDEFDFSVANLGSDLRDGIRITRVMEVILQDRRLLKKLRAPAISRLQKIHNINVALTALKEAGFVVEGGIEAKHVNEGHREKTLSLLWQIVYKFQAPRFRAMAVIIQRWWRSKYLGIVIQRRIQARQHMRETLAAQKIQAIYKGYRARQEFVVLRENAREEYRVRSRAAVVLQQTWRNYAMKKREYLIQKNLEQKKKSHAAQVIQSSWRLYLERKMTKAELAMRIISKRERVSATKIQAYYRCFRVRQNYIQMKMSAVKIQSFYRGLKIRKEFLQKKNSAITIQALYRGIKVREEFIQKKNSAIKIQALYRGIKVREEFLQKKNSTIKIQALYRGFKVREQLQKKKISAIKIQALYRRCKTREEFLQKKQSAIKIQALYRGYKAREEFLQMKNSAIKIQSLYRGYKTRVEFLEKKNSAIKIQALYRGYKARVEFLQTKNSAIKIQALYRGYKARDEFLEKKNSAIKIQALYRGYKARDEFLEKKNSAIKIQALYRGYKARVEFMQKKQSAIKIQALYRGYKARKEFLEKKNSAIKIQALYRGYKAREEFLEKKLSAIKIQALYRGYKARKEFLEKKNSAIKIQALYRGYKARVEFLQKKHSAIKIQSLYRGYKARDELLQKKISAIKIQALYRGYKVREEFLQKKNSAIKIQALYRGYKAREELLQKKNSAIKIQALYRGYKARVEFLQKKHSAIKIQSLYRGYKARDELLQKKNSAIKIQALYRGYKVREELLQKKNSAIKIQALYRGYKARVEFLQKKHSAIKIQSLYRGYKVREEFLQKKNSAIKIQSLYRGYKARDELLQKKNSAIKIQALYRGYKVREELLQKKNSAIKIQALYRGYLARVEFLQKKHSAIKIQSLYRGYKVREELLQKKNSAIKIQALYRGYKARVEFLQKKHSAIKIQSLYRGYKAREEFLEKKISAIKIQALYRGYKAREEFLEKNLSAIKIQALYRGYKARKEFLEMKNSAIKIQALYRGYKARKEFLEKKHSAIKIQALYRSYKAREEFLQMKNSAIKIQALYRGYKARVDFLQTKNSAIKIQALYRGYKTREEFLQMKNSAIKIQALYRCYKAREEFLQMKNSAIKIQAMYRGCKAREEFLQMKNSAIKIQAMYRGSKAREEFLQKKNSAIKIQALYRGYKAREEFLQKKNSAIKIQALYRGYKARNEFLQKKNSAIKIQALYRGYKAREELLHKKNSAIKIQALYRGYKARDEFLQKKNSAIKIQSWYRCLKIRPSFESQQLAQESDQQFILQKNAAIKIQALYCGFSVRNRLSREAEKLSCQAKVEKTSSTKIQACFRGYLCRKRMEGLRRTAAALTIQNWYRRINARLRIIRAAKKEAVRLRLLKLFAERQRQRREDAAVYIQAYFRNYLVRREAIRVKMLKEEEERHRHFKAVMLQAWWRGVLHRKNHSQHLVEMHVRIVQVNREAVPSETLGHRYTSILETLRMSTELGCIISALINLDKITKLSSRICENLCDDGLVPLLYSLIEDANRSVPYMEVLVYVTRILVTLARYDKTTECAFQEGSCVTAMLRLMTIYHGKDSPIFTNACTVMWIYARQPGTPVVFLSVNKLVPTLLKLHATETRLRELAIKAGRSVQPIPRELPAEKPEWGLGLKNRARTFLVPFHGICALMRALQIKP